MSKKVEKVALIGLGSIGRRYKAIMESLEIDHVVHDPPQGITGNIDSCDSWLICTPTELHYGWAMKAIYNGVRFMCEKPLSKDLKQTETIVNTALRRSVEGFTVCNYKMLSCNLEEQDIFYNYFRTGKDGLAWDCCQLLYIGDTVMLKNSSYVWTLVVNGSWQVDYRDVEMSYAKMIACFCNTSGEMDYKLWTLEDGHEMSRLVTNITEKVQNANSFIDTSTFTKH